MQNTIGIPKIIVKYLNGIGVKPIIPPKAVYGNITVTIASNIDDAYTILLALLWTNGIFAVLIICIPNKFSTFPYANHIV